ncbi:MAG: spermine synthase [Labilithrix sp.]|nr:spermine synthase [Labilithrix sp.]
MTSLGRSGILALIMTREASFAAAAIALLAAVRAWVTYRRRDVVVGERKGTTVLVRRRGPYRELVLRKGDQELVQSRQHVGDALDAGPGYVDGLHLGMLVRPLPGAVLFLGGGAGSAPRQFETAYPGISIDVVEDNPFVVAAATRYFGLRITSALSIHVADAVTFLGRAEPASYDLVVLDVYDASGIPPALRAGETFEAVRRCLARGGTLVVNLVPSADWSEEALDHALARAFPEHERASFGAAPANVLVLLTPKIPTDIELAERASCVTVARHLLAIVRARKAPAVTPG